MKYYLAIDIGASSGRHIIGYLDNNNQVVEEVYRFKNEMIKDNNHLIWDIDYLFKEVKKGIKKAIAKYRNIESMSIDTWGVDYVLMNDNKEILPCFAYRDERTSEVIEKVHSLISFNELYKITGSQFQKFNTIYQLYDDKLRGRLKDATDFLMIPEYLIYKLTNKKIKEYTNASTTGMLDLETNFYSEKIINRLGIDKSIFKELQKPGTVVGDFSKEVIDEVGGNIKVIMCATHDTASAVEGIEMQENAPYISSGTWSLLGIKLDKGINTLESLNANFSNEYGPDYIRFQKNIMGLWIIQCLAKELNLDFITMVNKAKESNYQEIYNVNDDCFLSSANMKDEIINYYKRHNKPLPQNDNDIINATYHSLAYSYKVAINELEDITKQKYNYLYIVGGGAKNQYLNELTEFYTEKKVIALPIEATSIGNLFIQMKRK